LQSQEINLPEGDEREKRPKYLAVAFCTSTRRFYHDIPSRRLDGGICMYLPITPRRDGVQISAKWLAASGHIGVKLENVCQYTRARHLSSSPLGIHGCRYSWLLSLPRNFSAREEAGSAGSTDAERQEMAGGNFGGRYDRYSFFCTLGIHGGSREKRRIRSS